MSSGLDIPETHVLAIASHVAYGYVGNTMATFVMQSLGCEVTAINTVNYSNHTAYKQVKGTKAAAEQILDLYNGLKQSYLNDFDVLLSGYVPSAEAVQAVGKIGRECKLNAATKPGSFFWVLDPVMGDEGRLYIPEDEVPQYKALLHEADLILPNQFEAELLSETKITDLDTLANAIQILHEKYQVPHVIITSLRLSAENRTLPSRPPTPSASPTSITPTENITIIGSTSRSDHTPRLFRIDIPAYPIFFSGTGDMFAALTVARLREAVMVAGLQNTARWKSADDVEAPELPLAKAVQKVLASMQAILAKTAERWKAQLKRHQEEEQHAGLPQGDEAINDREYKKHLQRTKAAEVRVVRHRKELESPPDVDKFQPKSVELKASTLAT